MVRARRRQVASCRFRSGAVINPTGCAISFPRPVLDLTHHCHDIVLVSQIVVGPQGLRANGPSGKRHPLRQNHQRLFFGAFPTIPRGWLVAVDWTFGIARSWGTRCWSRSSLAHFLALNKAITLLGATFHYHQSCPSFVRWDLALCHWLFTHCPIFFPGRNDRARSPNKSWHGAWAALPWGPWWRCSGPLLGLSAGPFIRHR